MIASRLIRTATSTVRVKYPESADSPYNLNSMMREGCFDSCDAAYDLCSGVAARVGRIGRGIGRVARIAAPILG